MSEVDGNATPYDSVIMRRQMTEHLKFFGYSVNWVDDDERPWASVTHPSVSRWNFMLEISPYAMTVGTVVVFGEEETARKIEVREAINGANRKSRLVRYSISCEEGECLIRMQAAFPPRYIREEFGAILDQWNSESQDLDHVRESVHSDSQGSR